MLSVLGLLFVLMLLLSCMFSCSETSFLALNRHKMNTLAKKGNRTARAIVNSLKKPEQLLTTILLGNNLANIFLSSIATLITIKFLGDSFIAISSLLLTMIILIFAEITPKNYALKSPDTVAKIVVYPISVFSAIMKPLVHVSIFISNSLLKLLGDSSKSNNSSLNVDEIKSVISDSETFISLKHRRAILGLLGIESLVAREVMIPKVEISGLDLSLADKELQQQLLNSKHTRLPVYEKTIDKVVGVLPIKHYFLSSSQEKLSRSRLKEIMGAPNFVPETMPVLNLLIKMRKHGWSMCFVVDEFGVLQGVVTLTDIFDELIGEMDSGRIKSYYNKQNKSNFYHVKGDIPIRYINNNLNWHLPQEHGSTLHGLIIELLEQLPQGNVCLQIGDCRIETILIKDGFVQKARIWRVNSKK